MQKVQLFFYGKAQLLQRCSCCVCQPVLLLQASVCQCVKMEWNGTEWNEHLLRKRMGNLSFPEAPVEACLSERERAKMLISLIALSCKLGSFMYHRITDALGMAEAGSHLRGTSSQNRSARTGCPGPCPGRFGSFPMMDIPQTIWATSSSVCSPL